MTKTEVYMAAELKGSHTLFMMLLTSRSWARPSVPCSQEEGTSILCGWGVGPKFASEIHVSPKFCHQKYRQKVPQILPFEFQI